MNEIENLAKNLVPHLKNHDGKDCQLWVKVGEKTYRLTGGVSTYGKGAILFATTTGERTFAKNLI